MPGHAGPEEFDSILICPLKAGQLIDFSGLMLKLMLQIPDSTSKHSWQDGVVKVESVWSGWNQQGVLFSSA